jgi:hypothetical protein
VLGVNGRSLELELTERSRGYQETWHTCGDDEACKGEEELLWWVGGEKGISFEKELKPTLSWV